MIRLHLADDNNIANLTNHNATLGKTLNHVSRDKTGPLKVLQNATIFARSIRILSSLNQISKICPEHVSSLV